MPCRTVLRLAARYGPMMVAPQSHRFESFACTDISSSSVRGRVSQRLGLLTLASGFGHAVTCKVEVEATRTRFCFFVRLVASTV